VDPLKYQAAATTTDAAGSGELLTLKLRYKDPEGDESRLSSYAIKDGGLGLAQASGDFKFAAAVAEFGSLLRREPGAAAAFDRVRALALEGAGSDAGGYRAEFLDLVDRALRLSGAGARR
jgi:Ca-activated chloride channel family protein